MYPAGLPCGHMSADSSRVPCSSASSPIATWSPRGCTGAWHRDRLAAAARVNRYFVTMQRFAPFVDETLLAPEATAADIDALCDGAMRHGVASVCVNPMWVRRCVERLADSHVVVAAAVGFPFGANEPAIKAAEAALAVERGAREIDVVAALGCMRARRWRDVERDIEAVVRETEGALVKVIIESALLAPEDLVRACEVVVECGAGFVKTSTGFHPSGGATVSAVRLIRETVRDAIGVKASG